MRTRSKTKETRKPGKIKVAEIEEGGKDKRRSKRTRR
jgi:hypothetical protein